MTELIHTHTQVHTTGEWQSWDVNPELADPKTNLYSNSSLSRVKLEQLNLIMYHRLWLQNKIKTFLLKIQAARINIWSNNITSGHLLKRTETHVQTKTCTWTFTAALFIKAKRGKQPKCSSTGWINKQNVLYPYSGILLIHKKEWSRQYNMVEAWKYYPEWKMSDIRSHIWYDSSYINIQNGQIHRNRKQMSNFQGWEEGKVGCDCLIGTGFPFGWRKCSGTRFMMFYTTLWMYKMSLLANFVFCVFYYIKKEWTWLFKHTHTHTHTHTHRCSHPNSRDSVDLGWDPGTYIFGGQGSCPGGFWCYYNSLGLAAQEVRLFLWNTELIQCNSAAMLVMDHSVSASIATAEWTQRLPK